jgi:hypothetical protein
MFGQKKWIVFTSSDWMIIATLMVLGGCGDDPQSEDSTDDLSSDESDNGGGTEVTEWTLHCPGDMDQKKDVWYCIIPAGIYTNDTVEKPEALQWIEGPTYVLDGRVFIGDGANESLLTIEPGAVILGNPVTEADNTASLIIQRNSKIDAEGTPDNPILFSSAKETGLRAVSDWGGVILNGNAPTNRCSSLPCEVNGEGDTGIYGGDNEDDNSGTMAYVEIQFSGKRLTSTVEFNGLTLQAVGRKTTIHHIHIHRAGDDPIEFFGGTAEVKYIFITGSGDDLFDWTDGWSGKAQFVLGVHAYGIAGGDQGIEADNNESAFDAEPRSNPNLYNVSLGNGSILFRRGTAGTFVNSWFTGMLDIRDESTWNQVDNGKLSVTHTALSSLAPFADDNLEGLDKMETEQWALWEGNRLVYDPMMSSGWNGEPITEFDIADFTPAAGSPLLTGAGDIPSNDDFFEQVDFVGAVGTEDWTQGWTTFPEK